MNFKELGQYIADYAPTVGMALSSPVGAVAAIGSVIAKALGSKNEPQAIYDAITQDPSKAQERINKELANNIEFQKIVLETLKQKNLKESQDYSHEERMLDLTNQDTNSARINYHNTNNKVDNTIKVIMCIGLLTFIFLTIYILVFIPNLSDDVQIEINNALFYSLGLFSTILIFYFGRPSKDPFEKKANINGLHNH